MAGYIRQDVTNNIADGNVINASDFDNEYNAIEAAFHASTGHTHDGTAAEGAPITKIGPTQDVVASASALTPKTDNTVDLGSSILEYKDLWIDGTANIDSLVADTADINAGTIDGVSIGSAVRGSGAFTTLDANGNSTLGDAVGDTVTINGTTTFVNAAPTLTPLTASQAVFTNGSKTLVSNAITGTGNVVMSASPTLTGTISAAAATLSSDLTLSAGTANGVLYLNGSKVATSGSALTFDGTALAPDGTTRTLGTSALRWGTVYATAFADGNDQILGSVSTTVRFGFGAAWTALAFGIGGSEQMRLTSTGLGIGTTPAYKLDVNGAINTSADLISQGANARISLYRSSGINYFDWASGQSLYFSTQTSAGGAGRSTLMTLDSSGNLGIGTSSPGTKLDVAGVDGAIQSLVSASTGKLRLWGYADATRGAMVDSTNTAQNAYLPLTLNGSSLLLQTGATTKATLDSSGNLGLGVTPSAWGSILKPIQLGNAFSYVAGRTDGVRQVWLGSNSYYNGTNWIYGLSSPAAQYYQNDGIHIWNTAPSGTAGNTISFTQAMTLDASGKLSLGTTSVSGRLNVAAIDDTVSGGVRLWGYNDGTANGDRTIFISAISGGGNYNANINYSAWQHIFTTNNTERMRLDSSGNLGLRVTPSAWDSAYRVVQIGDQSSLVGFNGNFTWLGTNWRSSAGEKYIANGFATIYRQTDGTHAWYTAPSGTAGNAITFTQAMTLGADGNLAVGTTTTTAGRFTVAGGNGIIVNGNGASGYNGVQCINDNGITLTLTCGGSTAAGWAQNSATVGTTTNHPLLLGTNNTERARITSGGDLLVGKTAADFTVAGAEIKPAGNIELTRNSASNCIQINKKGNTGDLLAFYYNDAAVVGTITNSSTNTAYNTSSDRRLKENIQPADDAGAVIDAIEVVQHDWKVGGHTRFGVVAQDLNAVAPEAVSAGDDGDEIERTWGVDYSKLVPMLIKEIQSLRARVAALEAA